VHFYRHIEQRVKASVRNRYIVRIFGFFCCFSMSLYFAFWTLVVATDHGQDENLGSEENSASVLQCPHTTHRARNCISTVMIF
jgi:hypothetical protein